MYKPKIGDTVYIIFKNSIAKETVFMLGENSFIHENALNGDLQEEYRAPIDYSDYGKEWFIDLNEAKNQLIDNYFLVDGSVQQIEDNYWEFTSDDPDFYNYYPDCVY